MKFCIKNDDIHEPVKEGVQNEGKKGVNPCLSQNPGNEPFYVSGFDFFKDQPINRTNWNRKQGHSQKFHPGKSITHRKRDFTIIQKMDNQKNVQHQNSISDQMGFIFSGQLIHRENILDFPLNEGLGMKIGKIRLASEG